MPTKEEKNIAIAEMLGLTKLGKPYQGAVHLVTGSKYTGKVFFETCQGEEWYSYPKFDSDANWQYEAIEWIENKCKVKCIEDIGMYRENLEEVELSFTVDICYYQCTIAKHPLPQYYGMEDDFLKLYNCRNKDKKLAVFEALYQFSQYLKQKQ